MRVFGVVLGVVLLLTAGGCSGDAPSSDGPFKSAQLAAAGQTPAFRNLGKRGDSKL